MLYIFNNCLIKEITHFRFQLIDNFEEQDGARDRRRNLPKVLELKYVIGPEIGTGAGGTVYVGYPKSREKSTEKVAIKVIWKVTEKTEGEVEILRKVCQMPYGKKNKYKMYCMSYSLTFSFRLIILVLLKLWMSYTQKSALSSS